MIFRFGSTKRVTCGFKPRLCFKVRGDSSVACGFENVTSVRYPGGPVDMCMHVQYASTVGPKQVRRFSSNPSDLFPGSLCSSYNNRSRSNSYGRSSCKSSSDCTNHKNRDSRNSTIETGTVLVLVLVLISTLVLVLVLLLILNWYEY
jgi:hypothetical protein